HYRVREARNGIIGSVAGSGSIRWPDAGTTVEGRFGGDGGPANKSFLNDPLGVATDGDDSVYIVDQGNERIRKVDRNGSIKTIAGDPQVDTDSTGSYVHSAFRGNGGLAIRAKFNTTQGIAVGPDGAVYVADTGNHRIRKITSDGTIYTVAGSGPI